MTITIPVTDNMAKKPFVSVHIVRTYNDWNDGISMTTEKDYGIQLKKKGNVYTGTFKAPTTKGTYKIQSIYVSDTIGNQRFYVDKRFKKATVKDVKSTYVSKAEIKRQLKHYRFINLKAYDFKVK
jgi:hypothetical protein